MNIILINPLQEKNGTNHIGGVEYHRMFKPIQGLMRMFPDQYHEDSILMTNGIGDKINEEYDLGNLKFNLSQTDLVIFSREIPETVADYLNKQNIPFGLDLDDYWHLPEHHIAYEDYQKFKKADHTIRSIKEAHFVTCTTSILAEKIKEFNPNVYICPNGIDTLDEAWQPNKTESKLVRFGFTGGNTHHIDLGMIAPSVRKAFKDIKFYSNCQVVLAGHRVYKPEITHTGKGARYSGEEIIVEQYCENILTDNLNVLNRLPKYKENLLYNLPSEDKDKPYRRVGLIPVDQFGYLYNELDVCVAPLLESEFNSCKSELKMLEAGNKDCAIMLHHVKPYTLLATDKNSFDLCKKSFYEWARIILKNPNLVADTKAQLKEDVKPYDLNKLSEYRNQIYQQYKKK